MKKYYDLFCQFCHNHLFRYRHLAPWHLIIALFGPEYGLCKIVDLRTKGEYSVPVTVTTADAAVKVKGSAKAKAEYQQIYFNIVEMDLVTS